jgi:tetratricopeptide (TPR) repeat protein
VGAAQAALAKGDQDGAIAQYRLALEAAPELGGLRIECANLQLAKGDAAGALATLAADPAQDRQVQLRLGDLLTEAKQFGAALEAYRRILAHDPRDQEARQRAFEAGSAVELSGMPEEYRRITSSPRITRADLAALVVVKIAALARVEKAEPDVAIDISGSWARSYILDALALDILSVYPNHSFQPGAIARRGDLARAVARVLDLLSYPAAAAPAVTDMSRSNLFYDSAARAVAAGLMDLTPAGAFEAWRPMSGREAADVVDALARLVGP